MLKFTSRYTADYSPPGKKASLVFYDPTIFRVATELDAAGATAATTFLLTLISEKHMKGDEGAIYSQWWDLQRLIKHTPQSRSESGDWVSLAERFLNQVTDIDANLTEAEQLKFMLDFQELKLNLARLTDNNVLRDDAINSVFKAYADHFTNCDLKIDQIFQKFDLNDHDDFFEELDIKLSQLKAEECSAEIFQLTRSVLSINTVELPPRVRSTILFSQAAHYSRNDPHGFQASRTNYLNVMFSLAIPTLRDRSEIHDFMSMYFQNEHVEVLVERQGVRGTQKFVPNAAFNHWFHAVWSLENGWNGAFVSHMQQHDHYCGKLDLDCSCKGQWPLILGNPKALPKCTVPIFSYK